MLFNSHDILRQAENPVSSVFTDLSSERLCNLSANRLQFQETPEFMTGFQISSPFLNIGAVSFLGHVAKSPNKHSLNAFNFLPPHFAPLLGLFYFWLSLPGREIRRLHKNLFLLHFLFLFLLGPAPALYTCLIKQILYVLLVRDKELNSLE